MTLNDKFPHWAEQMTDYPLQSFTAATQSFCLSTFAKSTLALTDYMPAIGNNWDVNDWYSIDVLLHSQHGDAILTKWYAALDVATDTVATTEQFYRSLTIASALIRIYGHKWNELIGSLGPIKNQLAKYNYNPLENYDRHEEVDITVDHTGTQKQTYDKKITEGGSTSLQHGESIDTDIDYTGKEKTTETALQADNSQTTDNQVYAFNSNSAVDTSKQTVSGKAKKTSELEFTNRKDVKSEDHTGTDTTTHGRTETISSVGQGDTRTDALQDVTDHDAHLYGNIGVTTSQQMLESELELRKNICYEEICKDILRFIAIPIY